MEESSRERESRPPKSERESERSAARKSDHRLTLHSVQPIGVPCSPPCDLDGVEEGNKGKEGWWRSGWSATAARCAAPQGDAQRGAGCNAPGRLAACLFAAGSADGVGLFGVGADAAAGMACRGGRGARSAARQGAAVCAAARRPPGVDCPGAGAAEEDGRGVGR
eukprot:ctg_2616.g457